MRRGRAAKLTLDEAVAVFAGFGEPLDRATADEVKQKYRRLARQLHPDVRAAEEKAEATAQLAQLNGAYETLVRLLAEKHKEHATETGVDFDGDDWLREAMDLTRQHIREAEEAARSWRPSGARGTTREALRQWAAEALQHGFVRLQEREYTPHDPTTNLWRRMDEASYFGVVTRTRTLKASQETPEYLATLVELHIKATAPTWRGKPLDLVTKLAVQPPLGENPGWAVVAWLAGQDWTAQMFEWRTRWHNLTLAPRPGKKAVVPKAEKLDRDKVEGMLQAAGMTDLTPRAWKEKRWAFSGATRSYKGYDGRIVRYTPEIVTKAKVFRAGARGDLLYYGKATRAEVERWITWARGTWARATAGERAVRRRVDPRWDAPCPVRPAGWGPDHRWVGRDCRSCGAVYQECERCGTCVLHPDMHPDDLCVCTPPGGDAAGQRASSRSDEADAHTRAEAAHLGPFIPERIARGDLNEPWTHRCKGAPASVLVQAPSKEMARVMGLNLIADSAYGDRVGGPAAVGLAAKPCTYLVQSWGPGDGPRALAGRRANTERTEEGWWTVCPPLEQWPRAPREELRSEARWLASVMDGPWEDYGIRLEEAADRFLSWLSEWEEQREPDGQRPQAQQEADDTDFFAHCDPKAVAALISQEYDAICKAGTRGRAGRGAQRRAGWRG